MKNLILFAFTALLISCAGNKKTMSGQFTLLNDCPEAESCQLEVMKNKSLTVTTDTTGHIYFNIEDAPGKTVVKYSYSKKTDPRLQDAGYGESIIFEINSDVTGFHYTDAEIQATKMLFGVFCFCRDKAGFYPVKEGTATYQNGKLDLNLKQIVDGQKLSHISIAFK